MSFRSHRMLKSQFIEEAIPHMATLYRTSLTLTREISAAEDLVQETFKEAWKSFHRYAPASDCKAWLFRILFRIWNRQKKTAQRIQEVHLADTPDSELALLPQFPKEIEQEDVLRALRSLPEHYQTVLILSDVEEFRYQEIAQMLDVPVGTVMSRLNRARALFRRKFLERAERSETA